MKRFIQIGFFLLTILLVGSASVKAQSRATAVELIPAEQVDQQKLALAKDMVHKLLLGMKNKRYYILSKDESTDHLYNNFRQSAQEQFYAKVKRDLGGDYNGVLDLHEVYFVEKPNDEPDLFMFRFKNSFPANSEVRVYVETVEDKFVGMTVTAWIDQVYDYSKFSLKNK